MNKFHVQSVKIMILESRIFAIVNRVGRVRVKQPIFDEKQFQHEMTSCLS